MSASGQFHLQWRGQRYGPWDLAAIREALGKGTIHSLYQIHTGGQWQPLREFLENLPRPAPAEPPSMEEPQLRESPPALPNRTFSATQKSGLAVSLPAPVSLPPPLPPAANPFQPAYPLQTDLARVHNNRMALACLVLSLCFWIPWINIISWLLSLVFGHIALIQISLQPGLGGRGLAMTGLGISYGLMILGLIHIFLKPYFLLQF
jgi:hypothetical protein